MPGDTPHAWRIKKISHRKQRSRIFVQARRTSLTQDENKRKHCR